MWKIGLFLVVISVTAIAYEAKAMGYCTGIGLNCVPVLYGHLLSAIGELATWSDGTQATWSDGTTVTWSGN